MFKLPDLPYAYDALEPYIDKETMELHHSKHHASYVDNLNKALEGHDDLLNKGVEELLLDIDSIPEDIKQKVINHGGGHANHTLFWNTMNSKPKDAPEGELSEVLNSTFGDLDAFKEKFTEKAMGIFGSGWAFLILTPDNKFELKRQSFQNSPLMNGNTPLLGLDVWEHAYYLKYQNRRADYIKAWWNVVNWDAVEKNFTEAQKK